MTSRKYRWDKGLRVRILGLVVFLLLLLTGLGGALTLTFANVEALQEKAEGTRENVLLMEQVIGTFAEMTSALRGYLLTGREDFLEPYNSASVRLSYNLNKLKAAAGNDAQQLARLHQISELVSQWQEEIAKPEIAARRSGSADAGQLVARGGGLGYINAIREAGTEYIQVESDRLLHELQSVSAAAGLVQAVTWIGVAVAAALTLTGFWVLARSVTRSTRTLAQAANAIARGERNVTMDTELDGELQEVAEAFISMSATLAAQEEELQAQQEELVAQNETLVAQQQELQKRTAVLEEQDRQLTRLNRLGQAVIGTIEIEPLCRLILDEYIDLFGSAAGALLLADEHSEQLLVQAERWLNPDLKGLRLPLTGPLARCVQRTEVVVARFPDTVTNLSVWQENVPVAQEIYIPLVHTGRVIGVVVVACTEANDPAEESLKLSGDMARQAAVAISAALNHHELRRMVQALQEQAARVEELNAQLEEERDRAAAQLEIYLSIVSSMPAGAWLTDTGGNLLVVNDTFREFFGDVPEGASLEEVLQIIGKQLSPSHPFLERARALVHSRDGAGEGSIQLANGYTLHWYSASVGTEHDVIGRLFTFQDVTEMAKVDRLKSEFVNTVSHELRTPLTSIIGYLSLLINEKVGKLEPQQKEFLQVVSRNTQRLTNLINDLLDIQRIESGRTPLNLRPVRLDDLIGHVAETFRVQAESKGLQFVVDLPEDGVSLISADPEKVTQIASNLVSNAVKYTREGYVKVRIVEKDNFIHLIVEDSGVGIPPAEQKRVFEKFYRGEDPYARKAGGTGLGLSIVKALVEEHGAELKLESEPGKGTRFTVSFRVVADAV